MEESIYSILPKQNDTIVKKPLYRSKYSYSIMPTGSTFSLHNTKIVKVSNLAGDVSPNTYLLKQKFALNKTLGLPDIKNTVDPKYFLKKQKKSATILLMGDKSLQSLDNNIEINEIDNNNKSMLTPLKKSVYNKENKKPSVPKHNQKSLLKCKSSKDFIVSNTVQMILSSPKNVPIKQKNWFKKEDFGKIPEYLNNIKNALRVHRQQQRASYINLQLQQSQKGDLLMNDEQVNQIRQGLKQKYLQVNHQYQSITHKAVNSLYLKVKKEKLQKQLQQIQDDIKMLNNTYIVVKA